MDLVQALVSLVRTTKLHLLYPQIITELLNSVRDSQGDCNSDDLLKRISTITGDLGEIRYIPELPTSGWVILETDDGYKPVNLSGNVDINVKFNRIIGKQCLGEWSGIPELTPEDLVVILSDKVYRSRVTLSSLDDCPIDGQKRSIVFDGVIDQEADFIPKNVNLTFIGCQGVKISNAQLPVGGIKLYKCSKMKIRLARPLSQITVIPMYFFYSSDCIIEIPKEWDGQISGEMVDCMDISIEYYD